MTAPPPRSATPRRVVLIDNYDSFTHNLAQLLAQILIAEGEAGDVRVFRNDALDLEALEVLDPSHVVLSPGPGHPERPRDFGVCAALVRAAVDRAHWARRPLLGVCLGHQGIAHHLGGRVVRAPRIMHGKTSLVRHEGEGVFAGLSRPFEAMRYHSLCVEPGSLPPALRVTARTEDDEVIMGLAHVERPIFGVQFHPESIGTPEGPALVRRFLAQRGTP